MNWLNALKNIKNTVWLIRWPKPKALCTFSRLKSFHFFFFFCFCFCLCSSNDHFMAKCCICFMFVTIIMQKRRRKVCFFGHLFTQNPNLLRTSIWVCENFDTFWHFWQISSSGFLDFSDLIRPIWPKFDLWCCCCCSRGMVFVESKLTEESEHTEAFGIIICHCSCVLTSLPVSFHRQFLLFSSPNTQFSSFFFCLIFVHCSYMLQLWWFMWELRWVLWCWDVNQIFGLNNSHSIGFDLKVET